MSHSRLGTCLHHALAPNPSCFAVRCGEEKTMATNHDQNFKNLILDYPRDALALFAPEEAPAPEERVQVVPARQEQLQDRLGTSWRELDVPLLVEWPDGQRRAVAFVLEEETDPRRFSPRRLARYCLDLADLHETDRVVPVVVFLHSAQSTPESLTLGTERRRYLTFQWVTCRLDQLPADDWRDTDNVVARVNLPNMRVPAGGRVAMYADATRGLLALESDRDRRLKYLDFIDMYAELTDNERREFERLHPEESNAMVGMYQRGRDEALQQGIEQGIKQGRQQGIKQGRQQGIERGRVEGERAVVERQLLRRFGKLPTPASERLVGASLADLERWADRVLDAKSLDDVFGPGR